LVDLKGLPGIHVEIENLKIRGRVRKHEEGKKTKRKRNKNK